MYQFTLQLQQSTLQQSPLQHYNRLPYMYQYTLQLHQSTLQQSPLQHYTLQEATLHVSIYLTITTIYLTTIYCTPV